MNYRRLLKTIGLIGLAASTPLTALIPTGALAAETGATPAPASVLSSGSSATQMKQKPTPLHTQLQMTHKQVGSQFSIIAGTGKIGYSNGAAATASFVMPAALATGPNDTVYIVDTAAQRIRSLDRTGYVMTVAGSGTLNESGMWVNGGYLDGPAVTARFNRPMGVAVDKHGTVYVADTGNHCIRRIRLGRVDTFAGLPSQIGVTDGALKTARFNAPRALAFDSAQNLYVADALSNTVRKISSGGVVSTLVTGTLMGPSGLSVAAADGHERLWISDRQGIETYDIPSGATARLSAYPKPTDALPPLNSAVMLGRPQGIVALENDEVVYTDAVDSSVKYLRGNQYLKYLGQAPREDAMLTGGGPDISTEGPRWNSPLGIAKRADGSLIVADTGNRRLISVAPFDRRQALTIDNLNTLSFPPHEYRIAIVGSSFVWYSTDFPNSIAGRIESRLSTDASLRSKYSKAHAVYFRLGSFQGELDLIRNVLSEGTVDMVVWVVSAHDGEQLGATPNIWGPALHMEYAKTAQALHEGNVALEMAVLPPSITLSPLESVELYNRGSVEASDYFSSEAGMRRAVYGLDASVLDLYPIFRQEIRRVDHRPLYASDDLHLTPYGRDLAASAIVQQLTRNKPWLHQGGK